MQRVDSLSLPEELKKLCQNLILFDYQVFIGFLRNESVRLRTFYGRLRTGVLRSVLQGNTLFSLFCYSDSISFAMTKEQKKIPKTYRLSNETVRMINELSELLGIDATTTIERSVAYYYEPGKDEGRKRLKKKLSELKN